MKRILAIIIALVSVSGLVTTNGIQAAGSPKGAISGKVTVGSESCGYRGAFVVVAASNASNQVVRQVASREKGAFRIGNLEPGTYRVLPVGFIGTSATVTVEAGKVTKVGLIKANNGSSCVDIDKKIAEALKNIDIGLTEAQVRAIVTGMTSDFATKSDIPDVSDFATKSDLPDVSGFALKDQVDDLAGRVEALEAWRGENSFLTSDDLAGYVTYEQHVSDVRWLCEIDLALSGVLGITWEPPYTCEEVFPDNPAASPPRLPNASN